MQNSSLISERELIHRYINGSEVALEALIDRYRERIFTYIIIMVKDRALAEDIFQDTFIKVINTLKKGAYNDQGKFLPWAMRIAHNLVVDHYRKNKRMPKANGGEDFDIFDTIKRDDMNIEETLVKQQVIDDVRKLIEYLPEDQKEVLIMRHYRRMSFKDIAEETNVSINTALGRMRYALINMRKIMEKHNMQLTLD